MKLDSILYKNVCTIIENLIKKRLKYYYGSKISMIMEKNINFISISNILITIVSAINIINTNINNNSINLKINNKYNNYIVYTVTIFLYYSLVLLEPNEFCLYLEDLKIIILELFLMYPHEISSNKYTYLDLIETISKECIKLIIDISTSNQKYSSDIRKKFFNI